MPDIHLATTDADILRCFPVLHQLRPYLSEADFVARIRAQQAEGYHLACLEHRDGQDPQREGAGTVTSVAGFRTQHMLVTGKTLYVDDLVTDSAARSHGHGKAMLDWLIAYARATACSAFSLDSGTHRHDAHAFYLRERLRITSFHFTLPCRRGTLALVEGERHVPAHVLWAGRVSQVATPESEQGTG